MISVCITGGVGSGKSVVCKIFRQFHVPVYEADVEAKKLYESEPEISERIKKEISEDVFDKKGKPDRKKLFSLVFGDESFLKKLNKIVHPFVLCHFSEWKKHYSSSPYVIMESAILFESTTDKDCDKVITVSAPLELRIQRTMQRDKRTREEVELIIKKQWSDEEKEKRSDFIIVNDEIQLVIPQVIEIHNCIISFTK